MIIKVCNIIGITLKFVSNGRKTGFRNIDIKRF